MSSTARAADDVVSSPAASSAPVTTDLATPTRRMAFEENLGQTDSRVRFVARLGSSTAFVLPDALVLRVARPSGEAAKDRNVANAVRLQFDGAAPDAIVTGEDGLPGRSNYFTGNDPSRWRTDVRTFAKIRAQGIYPGVDAVYYGSDGQLEYDFVVAPNADASQIKLEITGATKVSVLDTGELAIETPSGDLKQQAPRLYQDIEGKRAPVSGGFRLLDDGRVGIAVGGYDPALPLVIDPVISFERTLAGSVSDTAEDIAVDSIGATYVTGTTTSVDFPTTPGPLEESRGTGQDVFITKLDASGQIIYSAYVGGIGDERARAVAVTNDGGVIIAGDTNSPDFPAVNALQATFGGLSDGFVAKLAPGGTTLAFSTYLGGGGQDRNYDVAVDSDGSIVICGLASSNFPVHMPLFGYAGIADAFLARLTSSGNAFVFSTFFGGSTFDSAQSISIDGEGNLLIVGDTDARFSSSPVIPLPRVNPAQPMFGGRLDAFAAKFSPSGQQLIYSTPLGGRAEDYAVDSCVDADGALYVVGSTSSPDFPVHGPIASTYTSGASKGFLTKLTASGDTVAFSRFIGGSGADVLTAVTRLANGNIAAFGRTGSTDLECVNEFASELGGLTDGLIVEVSPTDGATLTQSYFGSELAENFGPGAAEPTGGVVAALNVDVSPAVNPELGLGGSTEVRVVRLFFQNSGAPPMPPSSLSAVPTAPLRIRLNWADANENETGFAIERQLQDSPSDPWIRVGLTQPDVRVFYDDSVRASTPYFYRVRTLAGPDESQPSVVAGAASLPSNDLPPAPAFLSAVPVAGPHVAIGWSYTNRDERGFEIERRLEPAGSWLPIGSTATGTVSFRDTSPIHSATHGYRVRALTAMGPSEWSNVATATTMSPPTPPPSAPTLLQDLESAPSEVIVSWTASPSAVSGYRVERRDGPDPTWRTIRGVPWQTPFIRDRYVSRDVTYVYRVRASNSAGVSMPTAESSITVVPPPAPTVEAVEIHSELVEIDTTSPRGGVTGYIVERRTGPVGPFEYLDISGSGNFVDRTVSPDTTYTYRVLAYYGSFPNLQLVIFSDPSNEFTLTTSGPGEVGATITVTSAADGNVRDGALTLREAVHIAQGDIPIATLTPQEQTLVAGTPRLPGLDEIVFAVPGAGPHTIALASQLPNIVESINLDATTQPGYSGMPLIEIDGAAIASPNAAGITVLAKQSRVEGLAVGGFTGNGIDINADDVVVSGCHVGVGTAGSTVRPNGGNGIQVSGGRANRIQSCLVSGNVGAGIEVTGGTTADTRIVGSRVGTDSLGLTALPNLVGVRVGGGALRTIVGGSDGSERCVISGNSTHGVLLNDGVATTFRGNYIGLSESGVGALPNAGDGVHAVDGVADIEFDNVISANGQSGCRLSQVTSTGVGWSSIQGSSFGVAADGRSVLGNGEHGIVVVRGRVDIGAPFSGTRNIIAGNGLGGILLAAAATPSTILGNFVGTNTFADALGQPGDGIRLEGASQSTIGNGTPAGRNTIAYTGGAGIAIPEGTENWVRWNTFHGIGALPVDLGPIGTTANDSGDGDSGANSLQNAPVLTGAVRNGLSTIVTGYLESTPSADFRIEFVADSPGMTTLGPLAVLNVETEPNGRIDFAVIFVATMQPGTRVTALASTAFQFQPSFGETSEMSNAVPVQGLEYGSDTPGVFVSESAAFFLKNANAPGNADIVYSYGAAPSTFVPIVGDWNGDGVDTGGLYDPATGAFFLRNSNAPGPADLVFTFGGGGLGLVPLAGDWNGDGVDTVSLYAPSSGAFFLRNTNSPGNADLVFTFGAGGADILPLTGDWNSDGIDTVGIYSTSSGAFFLRNANGAGSADLVFTFGAGGSGIVPIRGDWNGDGMDSIGIYDNATGVWFLKNLNVSGPADLVFGYGPPAIPLSGDWGE